MYITVATWNQSAGNSIRLSEPLEMRIVKLNCWKTVTGKPETNINFAGVTENTFYFLKVNIYRKYIYLLDKYGDLIPADEIQKRDIYKEVVSDISSLKRLEIKEKYRLEKMVGAVRRKMKNILKTKRISRQSQEGNK